MSIPIRWQFQAWRRILRGMSKHKPARGLVESTTAQSTPDPVPPVATVATEPDDVVDVDLDTSGEPAPDRGAIGPGESRVERVQPTAPVMPDVSPGSAMDEARKLAGSVPSDTSRGNGTGTLVTPTITPPPSDPKAEPKRERFKVMQDKRIHLRGCPTTVRAGQILDALTHPLDEMRAAGVIMNSVD